MKAINLNSLKEERVIIIVERYRLLRFNQRIQKDVIYGEKNIYDWGIDSTNFSGTGSCC